MTETAIPGFSPSEAAFVSGLSPVVINKAIDRGEITSQRVRSRSGSRGSSLAIRRVGEPELVYLTLLKDLASALQPPYRRRLYQELRARWQPGCNTQRAARIELGVVTVDVTVAERRMEDRVALLRDAAQLVVSDPDIRGGEPVVRGTRIPVYLLADLTKQGASPNELLEDFPSLTDEGLRAALVYARTTPRRGRPKGRLKGRVKRGPWHTEAAA
jgi:uncharacterized protein (DUF433 family)